MRKIVIIFLLLSVFGVLDAGYLTIKHYTGVPMGCIIIKGCDAVTASPYAMIMRVPVALFGVGYYASIAALASAYLKTKKEKWMRVAFLLTPIGFAASAWFVYLQIAVIGALCAYCLLSAATSTGLFGVALWKKYA